jgi:hypothetical protein
MFWFETGIFTTSGYNTDVVQNNITIIHTISNNTAKLRVVFCATVAAAL